MSRSRLSPRRSRPGLRYQDLGADYHTNRIDTERRTRTHVRQLQALGYTVTLTAAASPDSQPLPGDQHRVTPPCPLTVGFSGQWRGLAELCGVGFRTFDTSASTSIYSCETTFSCRL